MLKKTIDSILFLYIVISLFRASEVFAQTGVDSIVSASKYTFLKTALNRIENDSIALAFFYEKLYRLYETKQGRVNVVHIGDSHIQADFFSGKIRQNIQHHFGNAGRGFVFPYRVAKTNEPSSYKTSSNVVWESKRNVFPEKPMPIGIGGITIETPDTSAEIKLVVNNQPGLDYGFNKLTLFHQKGNDNYDFVVCDETQCRKGFISSTSQSTNPFVSVQKFDHPMHEITLSCSSRDTSLSGCAQIYGMLLENDSAGVLYNTIGVNGAEYRYYNISEYFMQQLSYLSPDLVIISMGTNEGFHAGFDSTLFYAQVDTFVSAILKSNPGVNLLLTTPGDSFRKTRRGKIKNPDMKVARNTIVRYCRNNHLAYWDLYEIMGGLGSMNKWYSSKLTAKDKLHFSRKGYEIQGDLFYKALYEGYTKSQKSKMKSEKK